MTLKSSFQPKLFYGSMNGILYKHDICSLDVLSRAVIHRHRVRKFLNMINAINCIMSHSCSSVSMLSLKYSVISVI